MTILFKTGAFTSRSSTGTDVITGVGFTPKVIFLFSSVDFQADDTLSTDYNFRFGVAVDTTAANQKSFCSTSYDTADPSSTERTFTSSSLHLRSVGGPTCKAAISAIGSDGFTVNWTLIDGATHRITYICIGGTDITNVKTGGLTAPASSQSQATTGVGFQADFLMFWGNLSTADDTSVTGMTMGMGFATSTSSQLALSNVAQEAQATMVCKRYQKSDNTICFAALSPSSPTTTALSGALTAIGTDGFTINWTVASGGGSTKLGYLAIKGGTWKIGSDTAPTSATTKAVSGIGVAPVGVILASVGNTSTTAVSANARISFGGGSSSSNNRCVWTGDKDAAASDASTSVGKSAKCITVITENATPTSATVSAEASVSTLDSTGFTLSWSTASSAFEFLYIAVGTSAGGPKNVTVSPPAESISLGAPIPVPSKTGGTGGGGVSFKTGSWAMRTTTGNDVITGIGFQPKILIFSWTGGQTADDTYAADYVFSFGVATDTTAANQGSMSCYSQDGNSGVTNLDRNWSTGALLRAINAAVTCAGSVSAIGSDGFTVNWTTVDATAHKVYYIAIGGTAITNAKAGILTSPTGTGSVSYTQPGFQPDFLMFWGNEAVTSGTGSSFGIGFATASTSQVALATAGQAGINPSGTRRYQRSDNVICFVELDAAAPNSGAFGGGLTSMDATGFTCNWTTAAVAGQSKSFGYLAVKGGNWKVGKETNPATATTKATTGVGFQPYGLILASINQVSSTAIGTGSRITFGGSGGASDNRCVWTGDTTAVATSVSASIQKASKCISVITEAATHTSSTVNAEASLSSFDSDGYTLNWSTGNATAFEFLYVACGGAAPSQNVSVAPPAETITLGTIIPTRTKGKIRGPPAESISLGTPVPTMQKKLIRGPPAETITLGGTADTVIFKGGHKVAQKGPPPEVITITGAPTMTITRGRKDVVRNVPPEFIHISDSVTITGKTKHTGDPGYWLPLKPRINIYAFTDTTYSSPLYTYDAFLDSGKIDKPIALQFVSTTTTAGTFSLAIDNSTDTYDLDQFARGNRITIDCSKDGLVWSAAYRGLVRSVKQKVFGPDNRIIYIEGFSYLIRLNERILSVKKQAALIGPSYDRNDASMHSDTIINDLLTNDADYVKTVDDTQLSSVFKTSNITASPIEDWIPRLDAQLVSVDQAINSVLEFSQSFLTIDNVNDQIVLFNPDRVPSGGANAFLVTDNVILQGDSSLNTMYPISDYSYDISYDFSDSANRLITAIGNVECPEKTIPGAAGNVGSVLFSNTTQGGGGGVGSLLYEVWTISTYGTSGQTALNTRIVMQLQASSPEVGQIISEIDYILTMGGASFAPAGTLKVGIWKASDGSFVQIGTRDTSTIPTGGAYYGYGEINTANTYVCQVGDLIGLDTSAVTNAIGVAIFSGTSSTHPVYSYNGSYVFESGVALCGRTYGSILPDTIKLNGSSVQRVSILMNAGNPMVGINIGRIALTARRGTTALNNTFWVGIRKADNTFIYFGGGVFAGSSFPSTGSSWATYNYDKLDNHYQLAVGDRISIETNSSSGGYIEIPYSQDSPTYQTTQIWNGSTYSSPAASASIGVIIYQSTAQPDIIIDPCGGLPETRDADPLLAIASDCNMAKRIGMVEQLISNIPPHVKTFQTMMEYLFNKLYIMARPRFTFEYPSLTLPGVMPKAGDIAVHVSKKANIGKARTPIQTGIITEVTYDFGQDSDSILGLRRLAIQSNGVLRGSY